MSKCECGECHEPMTIEKAREKFTVVRVYSPTLTKTMSPAFRLLNAKCLVGKDGECHQCEHFVGAFSEDGTFAAYGSYEGFCKAGVLPVKDESKEDVDKNV